MCENQNLKFNKFQEMFFPIYKYELKKFIPMSLLMFGIVFIYHLVANLKSFFILYNANLWIGAKPEETSSLLSALKFWYVLPSAVLVVIGFTALVNKFGANRTFYIVILCFISFYLIYGFLIYPNLDYLMLSSEKITLIVSGVPTIFRAFITCMANWPLTLYYIVSELWGTMCISFLFWQFANRITMQHEIKRFFGLLSLLANIGTILAGSTVVNYANNLDVKRVKIIMFGVFLTGTFILVIYTYLNRVVLKDPMLYDGSKIIKKKPKKKKVSAMQGIKILIQNPYMLLVSILVLSYGVSINFSEIIMYSNMKEAFIREDFAKMQGILSILTGVFSIIIVLLSNNILRKYSWKISALGTPIVFLIAGGTFLVCVLYRQFVSATIFGMSTSIFAVWCGVVYDSLAKGLKYSLFDSTKSMVYIPLDDDEKSKGQAAVEIIGGRAGKAGASAIQQILLSFPKTLTTSTGTVSGLLAHSPVLIAGFFATVIIWIFAVLKLSVQYEQKMKEIDL